MIAMADIAMPGWIWRDCPVAQWLILESWAAADPAAIVEGVTRAFQEAGLPVRRMNVGLPALHPEIMAVSFVWTRDGGVKTSTAGWKVLESPDYLESPIFRLDQGEPEIRCRLDDGGEPAFEICRVLREAGDTDYFIMPMRLRGHEDAIVSWSTDRPGGYTEADLARFRGLVPFLARAFEPHELRQLATDLLNLYVGRDAGTRILSGQIMRGTGESIRAALWTCDLVNFTRLTASMSPTDLIAMLNRFFDIVADAVEAAGGEILKFMGDGMLAIFPVDEAAGPQAACAAAVAAADAAWSGVWSLNSEREAAGDAPIGFGIGLHLGEAIYGNVGGRNRIDFTVIGTAVNLVSRLEQLCRPLEEPLVASAEFAARLPDQFRELGRYAVKGIADPIPVFGLKR
jgi:adenylate cyclase